MTSNVIMVIIINRLMLSKSSWTIAYISLYIKINLFVWSFFLIIVSSYCNIGLYQKIILSNIKWYPSKWYSLILFYNICQCWPIFPNTCEWAFPVWPFLYFRNFEFIPETTMEKFLVDVIIKWLSLKKAKNSICNFWYELWIL